MKKINIKIIARQIIYSVVGVATMLAYFPAVASAAAITNRSVVMGSSAASASTTYDFTFTLPSTGTTIKSVEIKACQEASGSCTAATGFDASSATMTGQPTNMGDSTGWSETSTTAALRIANGTNATTPSGASTVSFAAVQNPSATNATFYLQITTFTSANWTTGPTDTGTIAASTAGQITVNASVDETLTFTLTSATVALGSLTASSTGTGVSTMAAATNADSGYTISYKGATLDGPTTITAMGTKAASSQNSKQFGINMALNDNPAVSGSAIPTGGSGIATTGQYDTANQYKFNTVGEAIAGATAPSDTTTYKVSYIANIDGSTPAGAYTTAITYTATANF